MTTWPQYIWFALTGLSLLIYAANDGKPKGNYDLGHALAAACISFGLLYWGGFFTSLGWK